MNEELDRDEVIRLLDQLGSEDDTDALQAARDLHAQITAAGLAWDEILVPDVADTPSDTEEVAVSEDADRESAEASQSTGKKGKEAGTLELIDKLLASPDRSDALREELEEYKADITNGEFAARDHQYVRALYDRLT